MLLPTQIAHFFLLLLFPLTLWAQSNTVSIQLDEKLGTTNFRISLFYGGKAIAIDSISSGSKKINLPEGYVGFIRVSPDRSYEDFIVDHETFVIRILSDENGQWKSSVEGSAQNEHFRILRNGYKNYSARIAAAENNLIKEQLIRERNHFSDSILAIDTKSFFSRSTRLPMMNLKDATPYTIIDSIPLFDQDLIHCSAIPGMIMKAFSAIGNANEEELKKVIRYLLEKKMDTQVRDMLMTTLIDFFSKTNSDPILQFISDNFVADDHCDGNLSSDARIKLARTLLFRPGNQLPDVVLNGQTLNKTLKKIKQKKVLIVIWSQDCPHCVDALYQGKTTNDPDIYRLGIEVSGKPLEKSPATLNKNISEKNGWDADIVRKWEINRTPFYILIDKERKVLEVPEKLR